MDRAELQRTTEPAFDRFNEAHFWIHRLLQFYHYSDPFRWHLNAYLKAINEVPDLIRQGLQNQPGFKSWYRERRCALDSDPLMDLLSKRRNRIVHQEMLVPHSSGTIGLMEGRGLKVGLSMPFNPMMDSDDAILSYFAAAQNRKDPLGLLTPDDDSLPCVGRIWRLPEFEEDLVVLSAKAWMKTADLLKAVLMWLEVDPGSPPALDCLDHEPLHLKPYDRKTLKEQLRRRRTPKKTG